MLLCRTDVLGLHGWLVWVSVRVAGAGHRFTSRVLKDGASWSTLSGLAAVSPALSPAFKRLATGLSFSERELAARLPG
ncbi:hypothetical protein OJAV_G00205550 [Oryzias javanicus]|uniref:Uncharacterized protein n=1 Tax=Oryzias javanicus TaxID=123683 RepID=A0A437C5V4_ORYJA|nr:hypothetical protein OJAV_G00205550 [Oryzias javanicus]